MAGGELNLADLGKLQAQLAAKRAAAQKHVADCEKKLKCGPSPQDRKNYRRRATEFAKRMKTSNEQAWAEYDAVYHKVYAGKEEFPNAQAYVREQVAAYQEVCRRKKLKPIPLKMSQRFKTTLTYEEFYTHCRYSANKAVRYYETQLTRLAFLLREAEKDAGSQ